MLLIKIIKTSNKHRPHEHKEQSPRKLMKLWFHRWGGFNLNNPQGNISLIELKFVQ